MPSSRISYKYSASAMAIERSILNFRNRINDPKARILKRIFDFVLALVMLICIAPWLFTIVAIIIMIDSRGAPFFLQKRSGIDRKVFYLVKFRTMKPNKDANRLQVQENDQRITKVGLFLRKHHIDELPQVINVLLGDMSIVGPRPYMLRHDVELSKISDNHKLRYQVKPGMTGLAQVRGYHGSIHTQQEYFERLNSDIEYMQNWSLYLDTDIFLRTTFQKLFNFG